MNKKKIQEQQMLEYLEKDFEYQVLTVEEFLSKFPDFDINKYELIVGHTITWNNIIVTLRTAKGSHERSKSYETV